MSNAAAKILAIGDIHLGTRPASVPNDDANISADLLTPAAALERATAYAIENNVDAVLFAGDVVENKNARYEALRPLEKCIEQLEDNSIQTIGVAGNHDVEALPRLVKLLPWFKLLGAGGNWESYTLSKLGKEYAEIFGWSFGSRQVTDSPVRQLLDEDGFLQNSNAIPRIGLLHCDLGVATSNYAPVAVEQLRESRFDAWLLGHIHKPSLQEGRFDQMETPFGYLGSLMGLGPNETGVHGPWLLQFFDDRPPEVEQVPLAPLRWETIEIPVDRVTDADDIGEIVFAEMESLANSFPEDRDQRPVAIGIRIGLTGAPIIYEEIREKIDSREWVGLTRSSNRISVFVNKVINQMDLPFDLTEISRGDDPPALLARKILVLQEEGDEALALIDSARQSMLGIADKTYWRPLNEHRDATDPLSDDAIRELLVTSANEALAKLRAQRSDDKAPS
jgi:DNA repair exonuclease SbcCD nuclease subunit